ncbi:hypothetical protein SMICM304S_06669 [Streptomyces microflavus]
MVEMQFDAFAYPAFEQLISHVAKMRNRTGGAMPLPITSARALRRRDRRGQSTTATSSEAYYMATPGLHVVTPATVDDAYGLLRASIASDDPVVFLEPKRLYWSKADWSPEAPAAVEPIGRAVVRRPGRSATLITYGPSLPVCMEAAEAAVAEGWDLEVVDLRSLVPFDDETVAASVRRTGPRSSSTSPPVSVAPAARSRPDHRAVLPPPGGPGTARGRVRHPLPAAHAGAAPSAGSGPGARRGRAVAVGGGQLMAQVLEFKLPDLGEGLAEAEIVRWLVEVGDVVAIDQPVVEVETAKAMVEVPCPYGGVVTARFGEEGSELPVGAPLLTVAVGATDASSSGSDGAAAEEPSGGSGNVLVGYGTARRPPGAGASGRSGSEPLLRPRPLQRLHLRLCPLRLPPSLPRRFRSVR